ncbi:ataxin-2 like protein, putative [Plasmodium knowlesi strain H]|uniref:Ataxin-2 like protein, putative n=2 Tax=Plasmodium knowlesi TaxID=5850 RepID=A0A679L280_PLAKH|nr:ataxin-2 like protein, putative [Plasmodium knowlesi strain H]OTN66627.1 putative Ataxin-2 like protein [Plasmodium knowlesi]CAA9986861.1 ataxin-2 like protein, putative [Plasmodium knowlesi strain H]VVS76335.1 ataxin-2 like protein, putative [Plasmodium knowlesi strain H]
MKKATQGKSPEAHRSVNQERLAYVMCCLVGKEVNVYMKDGNEVKGLFHAYNYGNKGENNTGDISLNYARVEPKKDRVSGPINKAMIIPENLYNVIVAKNMKLDLKDPDGVQNVKGKFQIDTDISEKKKKYNYNSANRELKRWVCEGSLYDENKLTLDDNMKEPWDQFEHNRKLYGVTTTYKEELYTTNLDVNKIPQHVKMHADKIAKELENRGMHLDPEDAERDNKELDEEDLFGAVRQSKDKFGKFFKGKREEGKSSHPQGRFNQFALRDLKEKIQSVKMENEKKYPTNKQKKINFTISASGEDVESSEKNNDSSKKEDGKGAEFIGINALNLEPALPRLDEKTRTEWIMFKNNARNKIANKKDKSTEKQEFITAAKEFNEKLANKMSTHTQESKNEQNFEQVELENPQSELQTTESNITENINNDNVGETDENIAPENENTIVKSNTVSLSNSSLRPYDAYVLNFNNLSNLNNFNNPSSLSNITNQNSIGNLNDLNEFNSAKQFNMKHGMIGHNVEYRPMVTQVPSTPTQIYPTSDLYLRKNVGTRPIYPNVDMLLNKFHNSVNHHHKYPSYRKYQKEFHPFPTRTLAPKKQFDSLMNNTLRNSKMEDCVKTPIHFRNNKQYSYKNVFGEPPMGAPVHIYKEANHFPRNIPVQPNVPGILVNVPVIPVVHPTVNGPFIDNHPQYYTPYVRAHYPNYSIPPNANGAYYYNVPVSNVDTNYSPNKNMNMFASANPHVTNLHVQSAQVSNMHVQAPQVPNLHAQDSHINIPVATYIPPTLNYGVNSSNPLNMSNNSTVPNPNINMPPYPPEYVVMNTPKYPNTQTVPMPVYPQYQYQNYYPPSSPHGMKNS